MPDAVQRLTAWAERRLPSLTRMRQREPMPIVLHRRRIYIVPTGFGLGFTVLLAVMLIGALNYANNAALLLTCLVGSVSAGSMLVAFRVLNGITVGGLRMGTARAGENVRVFLDIGASQRERMAVRLDVEGREHVVVVPAGGAATVEFDLPTEFRGWLPLPRMRLHSRWPLGMFRVWSWLNPDRAVLVYPRSEGMGPTPFEPQGDADRGRPRPGDELASLREYRAGDPRRLIAWKLSARHHSLLVKDLEQPAPQEDWRLDWDSMHGLDDESRISRLARWVDEARESGRRWSLRLPDGYFDVAQGDEHYHRCMTALALRP
ncbi:DUF58 domain-containing protein [Luteibacter sp. 22Crub2.1]|uniref:DUF58 domain-containing protein n=1 Tax=Luteibacter sp. 22Crub2.1 TaxID=1283288 RepID=UPI0009A62863|nr:DUF58 domain-containing protein [Luteibacter sp. 22Crub2.1]SKB49095.1 Uncharacterized conserved protein (some members contain a von Willebrand factor type A (vWA) domain) [Luteibacter sp. 22Crub2.1]